MRATQQVFALAALSLASLAATAQTSVNLYGIVDAAVRFENNHGATRNQSLKTLAPGGMSQSRLGINVSEDMGDGWRAVVNMEHRLMSDTGAQSSPSDFWRQAWVGLITPVGRVTLGRQYNVLFDLTSSTYASYRYSPYMEQFKPELAMTVGNRQSNMVKYAVTQGGITFEAQVSAGEAAGDKTVGWMGRYQTGGLAVGAGMINAKDPAGKQVKGMAYGGSYTAGPLQVNLHRASNKFDSGFNPQIGGGYSAAMYSATTAPSGVVSAAGFLTGPINAQTAAFPFLKERTLLSAGMTYQMTPQFNLGFQLYRFDQSHYGTALENKANMFSIVGDYALSKRTDVYASMDRVSFSSSAGMPAPFQLTFLNGATSRTGYMTGVRHRF